MDQDSPANDHGTSPDGASFGDTPPGESPSGDTSSGDTSSGNKSGDSDPEAPTHRQQVERAIAEFQRGIEREGNFRFLFDSYYEPTRQFLARRVSLPEDRLDLTQETFLRVYRGLGGYRGDAQFGTWVFRIAFNTYLKWLRRARNDDKGPDAVKGAEELAGGWEDEQPIAVSTWESPLGQVLQSERRMVLYRAIQDLPEQMRRCTELRIYQDLSYRQIAGVMRLSIETVKVHLFQARKKLKGSFDDIDL